VSRSLASVLILVACVFGGAVPAVGQSPGAGKAEVTIVPGGFVSFAKPDTAPEPSFSEYLVGGAIAVNWAHLGIEGELIAGLRRKQDLRFGSAPVVNQKTPPVFFDSVSLIVPLMGNRRRVVPYATAGIGETTFNRTRAVGQPDTETFTTGNFGGGVRWYSAGRWGARGDYRYSIVRSEANAPGTFTGRELRKDQRIYGGLVVTLIR
jgi:hypothetical protein